MKKTSKTAKRVFVGMALVLSLVFGNGFSATTSNSEIDTEKVMVGAPTSPNYSAIVTPSAEILNSMDYHRLLTINNVIKSNGVTFQEKTNSSSNPDLSITVNPSNKLSTMLSVASIGCTAIANILKLTPAKWVAPVVDAGANALKIMKIENDMKVMMQQVSNQLNTIYTALSDKIDSVQNSFEVLKNDMEQIVERVGQGLADYITWTDYKNKMNSFFSDWGLSGNLLNQGYIAWERSLIGAINALNTTLNDPSSNEQNIKTAYDHLYVIASKGEQIVEYILPNGSQAAYGKIQDILFDSLLLENHFSNSGNNHAKVLDKSLSFVTHIVDSYLLSQTYLGLCYAYQAQNLNGTIYTAVDGISSVNVFKTTIEDYANNLEDNVKAINLEIARFYNRMYGFNETYRLFEMNGAFNRNVIYNQITSSPSNESSQKTKVSSVTGGFAEQNTYRTINNKVKAGNIIHLANIPENLIEGYYERFQFELDSSKTDSSIARFITVSKSGVVKVSSSLGNSSGKFTVNYKLGNDLIYQTSFFIGNPSKFSAGDGTKNNPYIIDNNSDFKKLCSSSEYWTSSHHYKLNRDLNLSSENPSQILNFEGTFDGNGHTISNLKHAFCEKNYGTISNLRILDLSATDSYICGAVAQFNEQTGIISDVIVEDSQIYYNPVVDADALKTNPVYYIGSIVSVNKNIIQNCSAINNNVQLRQLTYDATDYNCTVSAYAGGLVGYLQSGTISNCLSYKNYIEARCEGYDYCKRTGSIFKKKDYNYHCNTTMVCADFYGKTESVAKAKYLVALSNTKYVNEYLPVYGNDNSTILGNCSSTALFQERVDNKLTSPVGSNTSTLVIYNYSSSTPTTAKNGLIDQGWNLTGAVPQTPKTKQSVSVSLASNPYKTQYSDDEEFNTYGIALNVTNSSSGSEVMTCNYTVSEEYVVSYSNNTVSLSIEEICYHEHASVTSSTVRECTKEVTTYTTHCADCNQDFVNVVEKEINNHNAILVERREATTLETGMVAHYHCVDCSKDFLDEGCTIEATNESLFIPAIGFSEENQPRFEIVSKKAAIGGQLEVEIYLANNPGADVINFDLSFDSSVFTPMKNSSNEYITYNESFAGITLQQSSITNSYSFYVSGASSVNQSRLLVGKVTLGVSEDAVWGETSTLQIETDPSKTNTTSIGTPIPVGVSTKNVEFRMKGDINNDGVVNAKDYNRLFQYLNGQDVYVDEESLDINGDGEINAKDYTRLFQYLSDWDVQIF